jgi:hypothetical protein
MQGRDLTSSERGAQSVLSLGRLAARTKHGRALADLHVDERRLTAHTRETLSAIDREGTLLSTR